MSTAHGLDRGLGLGLARGRKVPVRSAQSERGEARIVGPPRSSLLLNIGGSVFRQLGSGVLLWGQQGRAQWGRVDVEGLSLERGDLVMT